ncbi:cobW-domain-containing protein [Lepidopterella palustris CBS 459.81]|uniref:CobW-domain-containing protein n=1 Tax=Lepidopterella palustris CBS 459.81 TaxID=1314670 RepID=A0A8E2E7V6_9PEZI|nr:cobW-domain-containing protein [Lepidopterella palustris CBS 459.81]
MPTSMRSKKTGNDSKAENGGRILRVTVLSSFLGSGKTTLLRNILSSPVQRISIDAAHIARVSLSNSKIVQMQNGCIYCTLRSELLTELAQMSWENEMEYVVIESSGISEPQQVIVVAKGVGAEEMVVLNKIYVFSSLVSTFVQSSVVEVRSPRFDTMLTVVDAFRFFSEFETAEFLQDRFGEEEVTDEDQRTISKLFAEQIEFANVIIINKVDMVGPDVLSRVRGYVKSLNPTCKIFEAKYAKIDVKELLGTGRFNMSDAIAMAGWLSSLKEMMQMDVGGKNRLAPKPETLEYGIGSFIYRARKPFNPLKLYKLIEGKFTLIQNDNTDEEEDGDEDGDGDGDGEDAGEDPMDIGEDEQASGAGNDDDEWDGISDNNENAGNDSSATSDSPSDGLAKQDLGDSTVIIANKRLDPFATRPVWMGGWSSAGAMLNTQDEEVARAIKMDFEGERADRRQEPVFIGESLNQEMITKMFDDLEWENELVDEDGHDHGHHR